MGDEVEVSVEGRWIYVDAPYKLKNLCKQIITRRWDSGSKRWKYRKSPAVAQQIKKRFARQGVELEYDAEFEEFLELAEQVKKAHRAKEAEPENLPEIPRKVTVPWGHQKQAFWFAYQLHACGLFMDMGTGKTKVVIDLINNRNHEKTLVISPLSVVPVWGNEVKKHAVDEIKVAMLNEGSVADKMNYCKQELRKAEARGQKFMAVINYESSWREPFGDWALDAGWDMVVCDESHRIKSAGAKCSLYASKLADRVDYRVALTGTPMANGPLDLYGQYRFLDKGVFGTSFNRFKQRYAVTGGYGGYEVIDYKNEAELNRRMFSLAYKCESEEVLDLPESVDLYRYVQLSDDNMKTYSEIKNQFITFLDEQGEKELTVVNVLSQLMRLQQLTSGFLPDDEGEVHELGSDKLDLLEEVVDEIPEGKKIVVFARFRYDLELINNLLTEKGYKVAEISGRENEYEEFFDGKKDAVVAQIQAGGVGIDLSQASHAIYYSMGFSLKNYKQSRARLHRPGQEDTVRFIHLLARGTVDEKIHGALEAKQEIIDYIIDEIAEKIGEKSARILDR